MTMDAAGAQRISLPPAGGAPASAGAGTLPAATAGATKKYLRGSSLLLAGRFLSIFLNFAVQVLTVRYLAKTDYGAFAYALSVVSLGASLILLGMGKALPRFVPMYHERRDYSRVFGIIAVAVATVWGLGLSVGLALYGARHLVAGTLVSDPLALSLLLVLIALVPIEAFGTLLEKLVAIFARPRAIFLRRHLLAPGCRLLAVLLVIGTAGDVYLLAYGYLVAGSLGAWLYVSILIREWRREGLLRQVRADGLTLPVRELFGFSIPLLSTEMAVVLRGSVAVIMLEYFHSTLAVAEYRAVLPVAGLNLLVFEAFSFLFVPVASRMLARGDRESISELYWQTAIWISVLSFPIFALTCSLAEPLTILLFGERYAGAGLLLALLAVGHYFNAALGFNAATLRVYGSIRFIVVSEMVAAILAIVLSLVLIRRYGALGAAMGTTASLMLRTIFNQVGLHVCGTGIRLIEWPFLRVYAVAVLLSVALLAAQRVASLPPLASVIFAAFGFLVLLRLTRRIVRPDVAFPELMRVPLLRRLLM